MHYHAEIHLETLENMEEEIAKILAPYQEEADEKYMIFKDTTDEYTKKYENDGVEMVVLENGEKAYTWDRRFKVGKNILEEKTVIPDHLERREFKFKELYQDFETFLKEWYGEELKDGKSGYMHNPEGMWDWYQVGGRWTSVKYPNYDPSKDDENIEICWLCAGTGKRTDMEVENGCNVCKGTGRKVKWPTQWKNKNNICGVGDCPKDLECYTLFADGKVLIKEKWNGENFIKQDFDGNVKNTMKNLGITDGYLVTIDYHC